MGSVAVELAVEKAVRSACDICNMNYAQYFGSAIDIVSEGCMSFTPIG